MDNLLDKVKDAEDWAKGGTPEYERKLNQEKNRYGQKGQAQSTFDDDLRKATFSPRDPLEYDRDDNEMSPRDPLDEDDRQQSKKNFQQQQSKSTWSDKASNLGEEIKDKAENLGSKLKEGMENLKETFKK